MGTDWVRTTVSPDADPVALAELVERQAIAYQSMWGWHSHACSGQDDVRQALHERLHMAAYLAASKALRELLRFPEWDDAGNCPRDIPELSQCMRVYPITYNPIFPPLRRLQAHRTLLPDRLADQIAKWKQWAKQAANGAHDDYLRELHRHETSDFMHDHWSYLLGNATASLHRDEASWAGKKPDLVAVRERILRLPEPIVFKARIDPTDKVPDGPDLLEARREGLFDELAALLDLARAWNANAPERWKVPVYEENYSLTFEAFRERARDPWLLDFLQWAEHCAERGFALYLDY